MKDRIGTIRLAVKKVNLDRESDTLDEVQLTTKEELDFEKDNDEERSAFSQWPSA